MNNSSFKTVADKIIKNALCEDIGSGDATTEAILKECVTGSADLVCKESGVVCGLEIFARVFELAGCVEVETFLKDGDEVERGMVVARITGDMRVILSGERVALNFLQRMSGIATRTREMVELLKGSKTRLLDTRKTTPGLRVFEKYAVKVGGGVNHRFNLADGILIKDNHIGAAGSIKAAVDATRAYAPFVRKIEVEVENLDMCREALEAGADIIMLDNMSIDDMRAAVKLIDGRAITECSGNVTRDNIERIKSVGVDFVSCGALTHSAHSLDFSLKNLKPVSGGVKK